jgi:hypothetical protein
MTVQDILEQPVTGIPGKRTPREEFELPNTDRPKEPGLVLDASGSNQEPADPEQTITKVELVASAMPELVTAFEGDDAMAKKEEGTGKGGVRGFAFCYNGEIKFGTGENGVPEDESDDERDLHDLSTLNVLEKVEIYRGLVFRGLQTYVAPALVAVSTAFDNEFRNPRSENYLPDGECPAQVILGVGDGRFNDPRAFDEFMLTCSERRVVAFAAIGHGDAHNEFTAHLKDISKKNGFFTYAALTGVSSFREIALDLRLLSGTAPLS